MYEGTERRRHRLLVTKNTEYHLKDFVCVGVRDRNSNAWLTTHRAVGMRLGFVVGENGALEPPKSQPKEGQRLCFLGSDESGYLLTTPLTEIGRPSRDALNNYRITPAP